jgi:glucosylceramidase
LFLPIYVEVLLNKNTNITHKTMKSLFLLTVSILFLSCSSSNEVAGQIPAPTAPVVTNEMDFWLTKGNQSVKLQKQSSILAFGSTSNNFPNIEVDEKVTFQSIDGFGYTLTGGSAQVINLLNPTKRQELLQELFGSGNNAISVSYIRISIGASDLDVWLDGRFEGV